MLDPALLQELPALVQVVLINLALSGDNAVVVGLAVTGLPAEQRRKGIVLGIAGATAARIVLALMTVTLLQVVGLMLAGGILLLWVCWKMYRELRAVQAEAHLGAMKPKTLRQAMVQIIIADVSMSLDNVLAVAGASLEHPWVLVSGLAMSVVLMGVAAEFVARLLEKYRWIAWIGLLIVLYVALRMIWDGGVEVAGYVGALSTDKLSE
jgi:YjbE family integral membrane protein